MRRHVIITFFFLISLAGFGQPSANDWIDYNPSRHYFKFTVTADGLQRISYNTFNFALQSIGEDISAIDPRSIQVFGRGEEITIHVEGEDDGTFNTSDFIEFYAQHNDGWADQSLYPSEAEHTNPFFSLITDTATYFVTWHPDGTPSSKRFTTIPSSTPASTPADYVISEEAKVFTNVYQRGPDLGGGKPITTYVGGKGYMSGSIGYNGSEQRNLSTQTFSTPEHFNGSNAPPTSIEIALAGINLGAGGNEAHHAQLQVNTGNGLNAVDDVIFGSYEYIRNTTNLTTNLPSSTGVKVNVAPEISSLSTTSDYSACAYIKLRYARRLDFSGDDYFECYFPQSAIPLYFNASNFSSQSVDYIYDLGQNKRYQVSQSGANIAATIPAGNERKLVVSAANLIRNVGTQELEAVNGDGRFINPSTFERDNAYLIITHSVLMEEAQRYRTYRSLDYAPVIIDIEVLYDQFGYGIRKHPLAIRNFCDYALSSWSTEPEYLFLLGKSIEETRIRKSSSNKARSLVPAMGYPPSDNSLTAGLNGKKDYVAAIPTGRLAARSNEDIALYLSKVREFENAQNTQITPYTIQNRKWQKHILHFAGGGSAIENNRFKGYLAGYQAYVEDSLYGGKVFLFSKTSGEVIEELNTDSVRAMLREGPALMTFFGHASGNSFDISVDDPSRWENRGRYPMVIANSCFAGNIHLPVESIASISEQYLFTPNEGAIAFIATPDLSYENYLNSYTNELYKQFSRDHYNEGFAKQMAEASNNMPNDNRNAGVALEMTLHGDPALKLYPHEKSELTINDPQLGADVELKPTNITTDIDSFEVNVHVTNLGRSSNQPIKVTATRHFANGTEPVIKSRQLDGIDFDAKANFTFATDPENAIGENFVDVEVDLPLSVVEEYVETSNNRITRHPFFVTSSDIYPIYPYNFGVIPDFNFTLKANTGYPFLNAAEYLIEIDTTDAFDNPIDAAAITQSAAVINWTPDLAGLPLADSTVFFWRVTPSNDLSKWREFSFQVIQDKTGWGQDHFFQYKNNTFDLLDYNRIQRLFEFSEASRQLFVQVVGNPTPAEYDDNFYSLDGQSTPLGEYGIASVNPGFAVVVIDSFDLRPWGTYGIGANGEGVNEDKRFGNNNDGGAHRSRVEYFFTFGTSSTQMNNMVDMIQNHVEDGHYLLFYTQLRGLFQDTAVWSEAHLDFFESLGADSIRDVESQHPYIFFVKKGYPETANQTIGTSMNDIIQLDDIVISNFNIGNMAAPNIGPAMSWDTFFMKSRALEPNSEDELAASVTGITSTNNQIGLDTLRAKGSIDLRDYKSDTYPFLKLNFNTTDNSTLTPSQLKNWHVLYDPAPDAAINPIKGKTFKQGQEVVAGVDFKFGLAVENVSDFEFGAFKVHYWLVDSDGKLVDERWLNYTEMQAGQVIFDSVSFTTDQLGGRYIMYMEVNPLDVDWHPEQYHFNNRAYVAFEIANDEKNPLLDVTFDGIHILNGDIVSPRPEIVMELKDENTYLLMDDTNSFDVFLQYPNGDEKRIPFISNGREVMYFEPATGSQNKARLTYKPEAALNDGDYTLKVMGRDASGNESGNEAYRIEFEVINRSTVTHVMNYPNPFTTSTKFVFTLTGSEIPDVFTIQILTVSGKVVREITKSELGDIHIGRNLTEYTWNGTDEYGDRLANGVYLYRVVMKINGDKIEHRETSADAYFTKEFGKMYLFR